MHRGKQLTIALNAVPRTRVSGVFYRSIAEVAMHSLSPPQPLFSLGARKTGQRFTPKNGPASLYLSANFETSYIETHGTATSIAASGFAFTPPPTVIVAISVDVEHVLDLTEPTVRDTLGTDEAELAGPWFEQMLTGDLVPTHVLARAAHLSNRFDGLKFNSVQKPGAVNLLVWPKKLKPPYFVEVNDPSRRLYQRIPK
ncbi:MAG: RES family NAD+ phosphorylase [Candidatus Melainabacteria bacterium]|nr:RES family NAD+ phosphorylase [Candidatus Melainabacteria bacterium]